ncbi:MAG TPA: hypothetical protein VEC14_13215, partial [Reyranellaceae bacterium]|nr:hypothetical protein [Reyranellaceae bacterium]
MATSLPARADLIAGSEIRSGIWSGGGHDANGRFSHCSMEGNQHGVTFYVSISASNVWRVGWQHTQWQLTIGETSPVTVWIDNTGPYELQAKAINKMFMAADVVFDNQTVAAIRRGSRMSVRLPAGVFYFDLTGTSAAIDQILSCLNRFRTYVRPTTPVPPTPPPTATPDQRAAAQRYMHSIVTKAEMTGTRILSPDEVKARNSSYLSNSDMVWVDDATVGAMRVLPASATPLQGLIEPFVSAERGACQAGLKTGNAADERGDSVLRAYTTCQQENGITEVRYIVLPRPDGTRYLFTTVGTVPYGSSINRVRAGDAGLRQAIYAV